MRAEAAYRPVSPARAMTEGPQTVQHSRSCLKMRLHIAAAAHEHRQLRVAGGSAVTGGRLLTRNIEDQQSMI